MSKEGHSFWLYDPTGFSDVPLRESSSSSSKIDEYFSLKYFSKLFKSPNFSSKEDYKLNKSYICSVRAKARAGAHVNTREKEMGLTGKFPKQYKISVKFTYSLVKIKFSHQINLFAIERKSKVKSKTNHNNSIQSILKNLIQRFSKRTLSKVTRQQFDVGRQILSKRFYLILVKYILKL